MKKVIYTSILITMTLLTVSGCKRERIYVYPDDKDTIITHEKFEKLEKGMTENEVWEIIEGKCKTVVIEIEDTHKAYGCNGNASKSYALISFKDGKLIDKKEFNLK